jgi:CubicO group peptidase (beta-lactamase class C family)
MLPVAIAGAAMLGLGAAAVVAFVPVAQPKAVPETRAIAAANEVPEQSRQSDAAVTSLVNASQPGCSAAVAKDGTVVWAGAAGLADLSNGTPVTTSTRFDIASVSKQFTATAILMLQRRGLLKLSDPIGAYVDGLPEWGATVTLDQLMHHTSRIPDYWVKLDDIGIGFSQPADQHVTLDAIRRETELEPGAGFLYSNSNYVLLAEVVGRVSGKPLPEFLKTTIFDPLGLAMVLNPTLHAPNIALSYDDDLQLQEAGWTSYGHTGIITTPTELARWGDQYRASEIIQPDLVQGTVYDEPGVYYAAGIDILTNGDLTHSGRMGGFITDFTVSADRHTVIAVMCNGHLSNRTGLRDALWKIWRTVAKG